MMRYIKSLPIILTLGLIVLIASCESDKTTNPEDQAPAIPPQSTMLIDFSEFPDTTSGLEDQIVSRNNWGWAYSNVRVWNSVLTLTLATPVGAFLESFNHRPVQQPDGSWLWQYNVTNQEPIYTAKLYGKTTTDGVEWRMLLTKVGEFTDFEWFTGLSNLPATEGTWTLNKDPNTPTEFLYIEWYRDTQEETANVKYTKVTPALAGQSYIFYGKTNEIPYNRFYQIFDAQDNRLIDIKWNYEMKFGRVKDPIRFGNENWYCWDEYLNDTSCPE
jgi:hypothetical protein